MKTFSTLILEYDCPECAAETQVEIAMPDVGAARNTVFSCRECGLKNVMTVGLEPHDREKKGGK